MNIHPRGTGEERRPTAGRPAEIAEADRAQDARKAPDPVPVTWARAQLRERIQRADTWTFITAACFLLWTAAVLLGA